MKTATKNAIVKMIEAMETTGSIYEFKVEDIRSNRNEDGTKDWGFSVFQIERKEDGTIHYRDLLSDPSIFISIAKAMGAGSYISVDTHGRQPEDWNAARESSWGKPYIRFY